MKLISPRITLNLCFITILLSFLFSCKEHDIVGMGVQPAGDKLNVKYCDTITLVAYSEKDDTIQANGTAYSLLGSNNDPVFGKNSASFYTQVELSSDNANFGNNASLDSIVLSLAYESVYGDTNSPQTVKVYELAESIYQDSSYFSNREIQTNSIPICSKTFTPNNWRDSVVIGGDTLAPQLRIRLNPTVGQKFLNASGSFSLADNDDFLNFFKGIYINSSPASGEGSIMSFNLFNPQSKITLYYHNHNNVASDTIAQSYNFVIDDNCARFNHFNHSKYQYANSYLRNEIYGDTLKGDSILFLQSMAGIKIRIEYPYITNLIKHGRIAINNATLLVDVDNNDATINNYAPPPQLVVLEEQAGLIRFLIDQYSGMTYFGGAYNSSKKEYRFNISRHIQQIVDSIKTNDGLYLLVWTGDRPNYPNRVVLKGTKRHTGKLRLQITYTNLY